MGAFGSKPRGVRRDPATVDLDGHDDSTEGAGLPRGGRVSSAYLVGTGMRAGGGSQSRKLAEVGSHDAGRRTP
jgi:hypothetical protein